MNRNRWIAVIVIAVLAVAAAGWFGWQQISKKIETVSSSANARVDSLGTALNTDRDNQSAYRESELWLVASSVDSSRVFSVVLEDETNTILGGLAVGRSIETIKYEMIDNNPFGAAVEYGFTDWIKFGLRHPEVISNLWSIVRLPTMQITATSDSTTKAKILAGTQKVVELLTGNIDPKLIQAVRGSNARYQADPYHTYEDNENSKIATATNATDEQIYNARVYVEIADNYPASLPVLIGIGNEVIGMLNGQPTATANPSSSTKSKPLSPKKKGKINWLKG